MLEANTVAHWKMDDNLATTDVIDSSTSGLDGVASVNTNTISVPGVLGRALSFDGVSVHATMPDGTLEFATADFSVSLWVRFNNPTSAEETMVDKRDASSDGWRIIKVGQKVWFSINAVSAKTPDFFSTGVTGWHFLTCVADRDGLSRIYIDGNLLASTSIIGEVMSVTRGLTIGRTGYTGNQPFYGGIDDVRIFDKVLAPEEVAALYGSYIQRNWYTGPVAYESWSF